MPWVKVDPVYDPKIIGLCGYPYHNHKHGCSNFCHRSGCPPTMVPLEICLDDCYFIYTQFAIASHVRRMLKLHPGWTIHQAQNIYYWQSSARKILNREVDKFIASHPKYVALGRKVHLDSWGINMTATMEMVGIDLWWGEDWGRQDQTYLLRYAGYPIAKASKSRIKKLQLKYPHIYKTREGKCATCNFRPCLKLLKYNPQLYVSKTIGIFNLERYIESRGWVIRCTLCGYRRVWPITNPLCAIVDRCPRCSGAQKTPQ